MYSSLKQLLDKCNRGSCSYLRYKKTFDDVKILDMYEEEIRRHISNSSNARWDLALTIARLVRCGAWVAYRTQTKVFCTRYNEEHPNCKSSENPYYPFGGIWGSENSISLFTFLKEKFGLCRTTVYNYLEVVDEFATYIEEKGKEPEYQIGEEAKHFQFWQLIEMTSLTYQERLKVQPNWTREQIRAYKKSLREKDKKTIQPAEQMVEAEDKPLTEAQQRFAKFSKDDLIDEVIKLEEKVKELSGKVETLLSKAYPYAKKDGIKAKHELETIIESFLKSYDYEIKLHGRKQGFKPFSGVVANSILQSYNESKYSSKNSDEVIQESIPI